MVNSLIVAGKDYIYALIPVIINAIAPIHIVTDADWLVRVTLIKEIMLCVLIFIATISTTLTVIKMLKKKGVSKSIIPHNPGDFYGN